MKIDPARAEALYRAAADIAQPQERSAYLDRECGDDLALRARADALLAARGRPGDSLPPTKPSPAMEAQFARFKPEEAGERIGPYQLLQKIGEGGFGTVWMAEQEEPVQRRVALKILKMGMDTKEVIARFEQERQALAMMDHANIAKVFDAGATPFGRPYFVMELVRGIKITDYCDEAKLPTVERLGLFIAVCQAVQHAHQKGIIHRDLKPSNIMVTLHDGVPVPKVIDFGVAKATQGRLTDKTLFTQFEQMIGTPLYMAPEQAEMSGLDIDTRSDIYALGVVLYELLTGRTPIDAEAMRRAGLEEARRIIREQEPKKPSTLLATMAAGTLTTMAQRRGTKPPGLIHAISGDLDWIVMKAIEKDRTRRYETASAFALDLRRFLQDEPVSAMPPSTGYQFRKFARRHKAAIRVGAAFAGVLVAATAVSTWQALRATRAEALATARAEAEEAQRQRAEDAEKKASAQATAEAAARQEAEAVTNFLTNILKGAKPSRDGRPITVAEMLAAAAGKLETDFGAQPALRAKLQHVLALTYHAQGFHREAIPLLEKARKHYVETLGREHATTLGVLNNLAIFYFNADRREEALALREEVLALRRQLSGPEDPGTLKAMGNLALSYADAGRRDAALVLQEELLPLSRKVNGTESLDTLSAIEGLADSCFEAGRRQTALALREEAFPLRRKVNGPEHPETLKAMANLALSSDDAGRSAEALALREEMLLLLRKVNGYAHAETLRAMNLLANSYAEADRQYEAIALQQQVLELRKSPAPGHPETLEAMTNLALSYRKAGQLPEVIELLARSLAIRRRILPKTDPSLAEAIYKLAACYEVAGESDAARKLRQELAEGPSPAVAK